MSEKHREKKEKSVYKRIPDWKMEMILIIQDQFSLKYGLSTLTRPYPTVDS
jgi:hypothetical protein